MIGLTYSTATYTEYKQKKDKDVFEKVIESIILDKTNNPDLVEYINSLPKEKRRVAILSTLGDDNVLWCRIAKIVEVDKDGQRKKPYQILKEVYLLLKDYVKIADVNKKSHGEVLTPFVELAQPMVRLVDKYDVSVWKNKNTKILDSSAGYGTFLILCASKLMDHLSDDFPDPDERFKWIVENCLYYGELQVRSVFSWLLAIDPYDNYKTNIFWGDFLSNDFDKHMKEVWKVEKFDLIIQNPPYQTQKETVKNKTSKSPKTQPLWHLFVQKSISLLIEDGHMVMVHPGGWRDIDGIFKDTQNILKSKKVLELHMHPFKKGLDIFKVKTNFDFYILKNSSNVNTITEIHCEDGSIENLNLLDINYISGQNISMINNLFAKKGEERVHLLSDSKYHTQQGEKRGTLSKIKTKNFNLSVVYMVSHTNNPTFWYSSTNRGHFGIKKVIWGNGSSGVIIDKEGEFGLTQFARAIVDEPENLENIKKALESEKFIKNIMLFKNGLGHKYNNKVISMLKKDFWKNFI